MGSIVDGPRAATARSGKVNGRFVFISQSAPAVPPRPAPLSLSVIDAIRRQVEENWNVPVGAREARELTVEIHIVLLPDGTVRAAEIADTARLIRSGEEFFRAMAESAVRAVWRASPLQNLPPGKYDQWREITFTFRPPA